MRKTKTITLAKCQKNVKEVSTIVKNKNSIKNEDNEVVTR